MRKHSDKSRDMQSANKWLSLLWTIGICYGIEAILGHIFLFIFSDRIDIFPPHIAEGKLLAFAAFLLSATVLTRSVFLGIRAYKITEKVIIPCVIIFVLNSVIWIFEMFGTTPFLHQHEVHNSFAFYMLVINLFAPIASSLWFFLSIFITKIIAFNRSRKHLTMNTEEVQGDA